MKKDYLELDAVDVEYIADLLSIRKMIQEKLNIKIRLAHASQLYKFKSQKDIAICFIDPSECVHN
jgi:hypothetical protein